MLFFKFAGQRQQHCVFTRTGSENVIVLLELHYSYFTVAVVSLPIKFQVEKIIINVVLMVMLTQLLEELNGNCCPKTGVPTHSFTNKDMRITSSWDDCTNDS